MLKHCHIIHSGFGKAFLTQQIWAAVWVAEPDCLCVSNGACECWYCEIWLADCGLRLAHSD